MPALLPVTALAVIWLLTSVSGPPGGPSAIGASKIPPPWALPLAPLASVVFPLTLLLRNVRPGSSTTIAPPAANTVPLGLEAWTWLSLMTLFVIEPKSMIAPAKAVASPADEVTETVLPVKRVLLIVPRIAPAPESPSALPDEPASVAELTLLSATTLLLIVKSTSRSTRMPPANASVSPTVFVIVTELPEIAVLLIVALDTSLLMCIPPPLASSSTLFGSDAARAALFSVDPSPSGSWAAPDLARAERLVARSGTRGMKVTLLTMPPSPGAPRTKIGRYVVSVLNRLGYSASMKVITNAGSVGLGDLSDSGKQPQLGWFGWYQDYPTPSNFIEPLLTCRSFVPRSQKNLNIAEFCDPTIDAQVARAHVLQARDPAAAGQLWSRIDHELVDRAPWVPLYNPKTLTVLGARVGNYKYHPFWNVLLDQLWVR